MQLSTRSAVSHFEACSWLLLACFGCSGAAGPSPALGGGANFGGAGAPSQANAGHANPGGGTHAGGQTSAGGQSSAAGQTGAGGPTSDEPPGPQYFGRWDRTDPDHPTASWGPVGIRARFQGTSVGIKLTDALNTFTYSVDGGAPERLGPNVPADAMLASGLAEGEHTLELFRRSEGGYGKTVFNGLSLDAGKSLLSPPARPLHKLEVVGDSISAGFGDEGMGGSTPETQNGYLAYGPRLARLLDAEWSIIAHSGQGAYRNLCEALPPAAKHMPDEFLLTQHPAVPGPPWDFGSWQPDVLLVTLGTNDFADYPAGSCQAPDPAAFQAAYAAFLSVARSKYPQAEIFALGTFVATAGNQFGTCNKAICSAVTALGDARMHCLDPSTGSDGMWLTGPSDYIRDWTHPTIAGHEKLAQKLASVIKPIMGW
jgi:lysophospholipase L1-like esterase